MTNETGLNHGRLTLQQPPRGGDDQARSPQGSAPFDATSQAPIKIGEKEFFPKGIRSPFQFSAPVEHFELRNGDELVNKRVTEAKVKLKQEEKSPDCSRKEFAGPNPAMGSAKGGNECSKGDAGLEEEPMDGSGEGKNTAENVSQTNDSSSSKDGVGQSSGTASGTQMNGTGSGDGGEKDEEPGDDPLGGPYMPRPVKQNRVEKRKKIIFSREQMMALRGKGFPAPKGFPSELMQVVKVQESPSHNAGGQSRQRSSGSRELSRENMGRNMGSRDTMGSRENMGSRDNMNSRDSIRRDIAGSRDSIRRDTAGSRDSMGRESLRDNLSREQMGSRESLRERLHRERNSGNNDPPRQTPNRMDREHQNRDQHRDRPGHIPMPNSKPMSMQPGRIGRNQPSPQNNTKAVAPLKKSANRWQPMSARMGVHEKLMQKVMGILNKLSPERHEGLFEKLYELVKRHCKSTKNLLGICDIVFDKAVTEASYAGLYAKLCKELARRCPTFRVEKKLPDGQKQSRVVEFKTIMLTRCQKEFEGVSKQIISMQERMKNTDDEDIRELMDIKLKKRRQGNVRFIGELFKVNLEPAKMEMILHKCIQHLLRDIKKPEEEDIVCLEVMLKTCGKLLDVRKAQRYMNLYFSRIKTMAENRSLAPRLIFKCKDLLDLRHRRWGSRNAPVRSMINLNSQEMGPMGPMGRPGMRPGARGLGQGVLGARRTPGVRRGFGNRYASFAPTPATTAAAVAVPKPGGAAYAPAALPKMAGAPSLGPAPVPQRPMPQRTVDPQRKQSTVKKDVSFNLKPDTKSPEKIEKDVKALIHEFYACGRSGLGEAALCMEELKSRSSHWMVVQHAITISLEKRQRERDLTVELLVWLFQTKLMLNEADFVKGLKPIFADLEELKMDFPLAPKLIDEMCQAFIQQKCITPAQIDALRK